MHWPGDANYSMQQQTQQQAHHQHPHYAQEQQQQYHQQQQMYGGAHGVPDVSDINMHEHWTNFFGSEMRAQMQ
jgi:hypothetical protein